MDINENLIAKLKQSNEILRETYTNSHRHKDTIRQKTTITATLIRQMQSWNPDQLKNFLGGRKVAGTDGSVNQTNGAPPHVLYFFQALAKTTDGIEKWESDIYVPLIEEKEEETPAKRRSYTLAKLELESAKALIEEEDIGVMLMDGALYHYRIDAPEEWEALKKLALKKGTLLVGVSEEITTENLIKLPAFEPFARNPYSYDRDLLFGVLQPKEMVFFEDIQHKAGLTSVWMRLGATPNITGFDMLEEQSDQMAAVSDLICTLTPKEGRGIPLWLDYIDKEIRITDQLVEGMVEQYLDPAIRRQFFTKMRQDRPY
ncbi:DNA double-strand break repair nuclease NurA [Shouchella patagoniensis]|uniref:DNA double-strand break repair nuclease NurA n=1 Tax=Shouchella patagoniensis TaxID=228576 RepID=UPI0009949D10|nr:DNA double-strand break repair nuclease NurA [Shouchella patagoniensis]